MIKLKTKAEMEALVGVGAKLGRVFDRLAQEIRPGRSTYEISHLAKKFLREEGCKPTFEGYDGFPGAVCTSVNKTLIHGIPHKEGLVLIHHSTVHGEVGVPGIDQTRGAPLLIRCSEECFFEAYRILKPGIHLHEISMAIQRVADRYGFSLVKEYGGHGLGREMHEDPFIYNYYDPTLGLGPIVREGMCLAIEPMVMLGLPEVVVLEDGWTVQSRDGKINAHYENDVIITSTGAIITSVDSNVRRHLSELENKK